MKNVLLDNKNNFNSCNGINQFRIVTKKKHFSLNSFLLLPLQGKSVLRLVYDAYSPRE